MMDMCEQDDMEDNYPLYNAHTEYFIYTLCKEACFQGDLTKKTMGIIRKEISVVINSIQLILSSNNLDKFFDMYFSFKENGGIDNIVFSISGPVVKDEEYWRSEVD